MKMGLNNLVYWYQKKIGTYDKQQWEKSVEQRIFGGFTHVPMRKTKLKTEFIDVDLVRGSFFPKAKPKHGFSTMAYFAIKRLLFLPFQSRWWIQQTSSAIFIFFLLLYVLQLYSLILYYIQTSDKNDSDVISISEILIPLVMMLILSIIHSQIVSTHSSISTRENKRQKIFQTHSGKYKKSKIIQSFDVSKTFNNTSQVSKIKFETPSTVKCFKKLNTEKLSSNAINKHLHNGNEVLSTDENTELLYDALCSLPDMKGTSICNENIVFINTVKNDDSCENFDKKDVASDNDRKNELIDSKVEATNETSEKKIFSASTLQNIDSNFQDKVIYDVFTKDTNVSKLRNSPISCDCDENNEDEEDEVDEEDEEEDYDETENNNFFEATTSAAEWMGVTTNSEDCYSSEFEESESRFASNFYLNEDSFEHPFSWDFNVPPSSSTCPSSDRISCTIWTHGDIKKAKLSVLDIISAIIKRVETTPESMDYFYGGLILAIILSLVPSTRRLNDHFNVDFIINSTIRLNSNMTLTNVETYSDFIVQMINISFGTTLWERSIILVSACERLVLSFLIFFLLAVAERTYQQRLMYAKLFSHLTSSRRARKSDLPHFRLNKVQNIRSWLKIRSYLKRRGPQRSVDVIVSSTFIVTLLLLSFVSLELINDLDSLHAQYNVEALFWSFAFGMFILRFMTLGTKINKKYRNLSTLITEQINLYLQIEQKPHKKDELMVANSVLKLAADLIKELENPFKISGLSDNPYLYTITKVVLLSALSGVLSELLGFKLKLHKIKIK